MDYFNSILGHLSAGANPIGQLLAFGADFAGAYSDLYSKLQEGKSMLRLKASQDNWNAKQKHQANVEYKKVCPALHRSNSCDVFSGF